jgi:hypothetical protein
MECDRFLQIFTFLQQDLQSSTTTTFIFITILAKQAKREAGYSLACGN